MFTFRRCTCSLAVITLLTAASLSRASDAFGIYARGQIDAIAGADRLPIILPASTLREGSTIQITSGSDISRRQLPINDIAGAGDTSVINAIGRIGATPRADSLLLIAPASNISNHLGMIGIAGLSDISRRQLSLEGIVCMRAISAINTIDRIDSMTL